MMIFCEKFKFNNDVQFVNFMNNVHYLYIIGWIPKKEAFEELPLQIKKLIPSNIKVLVFELKPLP